MGQGSGAPFMSAARPWERRRCRCALHSTGTCSSWRPWTPLVSFSGSTQSVIDRVKERSRRPVQSSRNRSDRAAITFHRRPRAHRTQRPTRSSDEPDPRQVSQPSAGPQVVHLDEHRPRQKSLRVGMQTRFGHLAITTTDLTAAASDNNFVDHAAQGANQVSPPSSPDD